MIAVKAFELGLLALPIPLVIVVSGVVGLVMPNSMAPAPANHPITAGTAVGFARRAAARHRWHLHSAGFL